MLVMQRNSPLGLSAKSQPNHVSPGADHYRGFLRTMALHLGMSEKDAESMVDDVVSRTRESFQWQKEKYGLKVWLAKHLVHDCLFRLNSTLFSEAGSGTKTAGSKGGRWGITRAVGFHMGDLLAYILCDVSGFTETEVAQIVNGTEARTRQSLARYRTACKKSA
jgi:hypothetical protein